MTSNCSEEMYDATGYTTMLNGYRDTLNIFVGPTEVLCCGDTLQVDDYSKFNWTMFDPQAKKARHEKTFQDYLVKARELGSRM